MAQNMDRDRKGIEFLDDFENWESISLLLKFLTDLFLGFLTTASSLT